MTSMNFQSKVLSAFGIVGEFALHVLVSTILAALILVGAVILSFVGHWAAEALDDTFIVLIFRWLDRLIVGVDALLFIVYLTYSITDTIVEIMHFRSKGQSI